MGSPDPFHEYGRLRSQSLKLRADAMRMRILAAHTVCRFARTQVALGSSELAQVSISKVRRVIDEIRWHISEPGHVSSESADELRALLAQLETETRDTMESFGASSN